MKLWIVGQIFENGEPWTFHGVFTSEEKAIAACELPTFFIGPIELDLVLPLEREDWPNSYYPLFGLKNKT